MSCFIPKRNKVPAIRLGGDPGIFGFKTITAKVKFLLHGHNIVKERYTKSKDQNYFLQCTNLDRLVLSPKYLPELRNHSSAQLSASHASVRNTIGEYSGVDIILKDRQSFDICRGPLMKSLPTIIPVLATELKSHLNKTLKDCNEQEYTHCLGRRFVYSLNETATSIIFVGPELSRDKEWRKAFAEIQPAVASVILWLTPLPEIARYFLGPFLPARRRLKAVHEKIWKWLFESGSGKGASDSDFPTIFQHYKTTSKSSDEREIVAKFCVLSTSAVHTVTNAVTQALLNLCTMPHYVKDLRDEIDQALRGNNGSWDFTMIKQLRKLDSFLKESQRWSPPSYLAVNRVVMSELRLSDGTVLPKGQFISFPSGPMAMDAEYHDKPEIFDGYRFYNADGNKYAAEGTAPHELAGIEPGNLHWGNGKSTCPGRWYASAVMKLMIGLILTDYDVRFPEGQTERPKDAYLDTMIQPNDKQILWFRKRR